MRIVIVLHFFLILIYSQGFGQTFLEDFDDINTLEDWYFINNSDSQDQSWHQGDPAQFSSHQGATNSFLGVGYQSSSASTPVTLSNWAITPTRTFNNGDIVTFYTRRVDVTPVFPDRIEVRLSEDGNNLDIGFSPEDVGTFTTLLLSVNPALSSSGYPSTWTQYTITLTGLSGPTNGRIGFRYYVIDGGPGGSNSNYIGIDSYTYYTAQTPPVNDECVNAIGIDHTASCTPIQGLLELATESIPGCDGIANNDVWYQFTANSNASSIELVSSSDMDPVLEVFSGTCANLNSMLCLNATYDGEDESTTIGGLIPGQDYYIRVYDWYDWIPNTMDFSLCLETFDQCNIDAGINSTSENEICGDNNNGGCYMTNPVYQYVTCGETVFGSCWAENGNKDFDWYRFEIYESGLTSFLISSEFPVTVDIFNIGDCSVPQLITTESYNSCEQNTFTVNLPSGTFAAVVKPTTTNELLCGSYNEYEIGFELPESIAELNLSGAIEFCEGSPIQLYSTNQAGGVFNWGVGGNNIASTDTLLVDFSGSVYLNYTNQNGCPSPQSETVEMIMNPLNSANFFFESNSMCIGEGILIPTVMNPGEGVFSSTTGLELDVASGAINVDNSSLGVYVVTHQTDGTCPDSVSIEISIEDCTALEENNLEFSLIPNPCTHTIEVSSNQGGIISIYTSHGDLIYKGFKTPELSLNILTQKYSPGIYYIAFHNSENSSVQKLIKL
jgi:hypothetical protein